MEPEGTTTDPDVLFEDAYATYRERLLWYVRARTRDDAAAEDICQEAFARLLVQLRHGPVPDNLAGWLLRVALNLVVSGARRQKVAAARTPTRRESEGSDPTVEAAIVRERYRDLLRGLEGVPERHRPVLAMAAVGMTSAQIALRLGTQDGAARTRLHRARRILREHIAVS